MFVDTNWFVCLRTSLAACFAFASEFETFLVWLRFPGCACLFTTATNRNSFFCRTALGIFWSCIFVFNKFVEKRVYFDACAMSLKSFWKWMMNSNISNSSNWWERLRCEWKRICFCTAAVFKTEQLKQDDIARCMCIDNLLSLPVFLCGKGSEGSAVTAVCFGFASFYLTLDVSKADPANDVRPRATSGFN